MDCNIEIIEMFRLYKNCGLYYYRFVIVDVVYRLMRGENRNQCVLIFGEFGLGKIEVFKKIFQFIVISFKYMKDVEQVKDCLFQLNLLLEVRLFCFKFYNFDI